MLKADAADLVEQHVMRKGVAERVVAAAFGDAVGDAECRPLVDARIGGATALVKRLTSTGCGKAQVARCPLESHCEGG